MILQITKNDKDVFELINFIAQHYPLHVTQPKRIKEVIDQINFDNLTVIVEENYIDKQYRDCYYSYYSQKYCYYERECVRLTFFDEKLDNDDLIEKDDAYFHLAKKSLYNEIAIVLGMSFDETKEYIINRLK